MAGTGSLRRLLQVLEIEEEQARTALESVLAECELLERRLRALLDQQRSGRQLVTASALNGSLTDRWAGLEQARLAVRQAGRLTPRIEEAEILVATRRQEYLAKRVERRQAETLIEEAEAREAVEAHRRDQQGLDEWYLNRLARNRREQERRDRSDRPGAAAKDAGDPQERGSDVADEQSLKDANA